MSVNVISLANLKDALQKASVGNRLAIDIDGKRRVVCQVLDVLEEEEQSSDEELEHIIEKELDELRAKVGTVKLPPDFKPLTREEANERKD